MSISSSLRIWSRPQQTDLEQAHNLKDVSAGGSDTADRGNMQEVPIKTENEDTSPAVTNATTISPEEQPETIATDCLPATITSPRVKSLQMVRHRSKSNMWYYPGTVTGVDGSSRTHRRSPPPRSYWRPPASVRSLGPRSPGSRRDSSPSVHRRSAPCTARAHRIYGGQRGWA